MSQTTTDDGGGSAAGSAGERDQLFVRVTFPGEGWVESLPEVVTALSAVDDAWALAWLVERTRHEGLYLDDQIRDSLVRNASGELHRLPMPKLEQSLQHLLRLLRGRREARGSLAGGQEPTVRISKQSPLWVELVSTGAVSLGVWRTFVFWVRNAENIGSAFPRMGAGWNRGWSDLEDAATRRDVAQLRRLMARIELEQAKQLSDLAETMEMLGPVVVHTNVPEVDIALPVAEAQPTGEAARAVEPDPGDAGPADGR